jgi:hypothetical protein
VPWAADRATGLDAGRFHWSRVPLIKSRAGLIEVGSYLVWLTRENSYAAPVVKIQKEPHRGEHRAYAYVRHPRVRARRLPARRAVLVVRGGPCRRAAARTAMAFRAALEERLMPSSKAIPTTPRASVTASVPYRWSAPGGRYGEQVAFIFRLNFQA